MPNTVRFSHRLRRGFSAGFMRWTRPPCLAPTRCFDAFLLPPCFAPVTTDIVAAKPLGRKTLRPQWATSTPGLQRGLTSFRNISCTTAINLYRLYLLTRADWC
jgi:hypothetical protein